MAEHTPGPWTARLESTRYVIQHVPADNPGLRAVAVTAGSYPLSQENARLIAAAPDLLEACNFALTEALAYCGEEENDDSPNGEIIRRMKAAIATATATAEAAP